MDLYGFVLDLSVQSLLVGLKGLATFVCRFGFVRLNCTHSTFWLRSMRFFARILVLGAELEENTKENEGTLRTPCKI